MYLGHLSEKGTVVSYFVSVTRSQNDQPKSQSQKPAWHPQTVIGHHCLETVVSLKLKEQISAGQSCR